jgi:imidazolonepropionase-like amidohydrolase
MARIVFRNGRVFDGGLEQARPADVVVQGDRITAVDLGAEPRDDDRVIDAAGCVVMPGLIEGHAHLTFPSGTGSLEPGFNPPLDVSYFLRDHPLEELHETAARNARLLLDAGFTSAYSAGSLLPGDTEVWLRDAISAGHVPGPRLRTASTERDNHFEGHGGDKQGADGDPRGVADFVRQMAAAGFENIKLLLSNDDVFTEGGSQMTQYTDAEAAAARDAAAEAGVFLNCHAQAAAAVKMAVRNGFRAIYHCSYAAEEAIDLLEEHRDDLFVGPAVGIMWANVHEGEEFGIDAAAAEKMGSPASLDAMIRLYPELRRRGVRIVPGGDYGFPNNPNGRNARDLGLFVRLFGFSPVEALHAATAVGGELLARPRDLGRIAPGYLADLLVVSGDPTEDVTVPEDQDNLLAIMQDGAFHKLSEQLTARGKADASR